MCCWLVGRQVPGSLRVSKLARARTGPPPSTPHWHTPIPWCCGCGHGWWRPRPHPGSRWHMSTLPESRPAAAPCSPSRHSSRPKGHPPSPGRLHGHRRTGAAAAGWRREGRGARCSQTTRGALSMATKKNARISNTKKKYVFTNSLKYIMIQTNTPAPDETLPVTSGVWSW